MKWSVILLSVVLFVACGKIEYTATWDGKYAKEFRQGAGTESDPYLIASAQELAFLAQEINFGYTYAGKYLKLTADLDMQGKENNKCLWPVIGRNGSFRGYFDGNGHRIRNIWIDGAGRSAPGGLFGKIGSGGTVSKVRIEEAGCIGNSGRPTGAVAGENEGLVTGCRVLGVSNMDGGVVGTNSGQVVACVSAGEMDKVSGGIVDINSGTVSNCRSQANISGYLDVGGICGTNEGNVTGCVFTGVCSAYNTVGGIIGRLTGKSVTNCYNRGQVKGEAEGKEKYIGGIVGLSFGLENTRNCYNAGTGGNPLEGGSSYQDPMYNCYYDIRNYRDYYDTYKHYYNDRYSYGYHDYFSEGKTTQFMKSAAFVRLLNENSEEGVWKMDDTGINDGYPVLKNIDYGE